jgi:hypothetical protein
MPVSMPDEKQLPPGPLRDLTCAIHVLYASAGKPGTRKISEAIRGRDDLPDTVSHEAVRNILLGSQVGWPKIRCVIEQLSAWAVDVPDPKSEIKRFHELWITVEELAMRRMPEPRGGQDGQVVTDHVPLSTSPGSAAISVEADGQDAIYHAKEKATPQPPLISWRTKTGTLDVYDRQMAIDLIRDIGSF